MQLAVISDIHGNCFALDQVLEDIRRQGIEQIVCLGDAIQGGAQPAETAARLRELNCPVVMGNADDWLLTGKVTSTQEKISEQQRAVRTWVLGSSPTKTWPLYGSSSQPSRSHWKVERSCSAFMAPLILTMISCSLRHQMKPSASF